MAREPETLPSDLSLGELRRINDLCKGFEPVMYEVTAVF